MWIIKISGTFQEIQYSAGYIKGFGTKRSAILRVWLTAILWLLVLRLDRPWTLSYQVPLLVDCVRMYVLVDQR